GNISWNLLALPFWSGCLLLFAAMMAILAAGLNVLFRDVGAVAPNILSLFFWLTPIVWPVSQLPESWRFLLFFNPPAIIIEGYRSAILGTAPPLTLPWTVFFALLLVAGASLAFLAFRRIRSSFADVL
ncbi:MAG: ABC transporter permease, partial [Bosea sp. (in: a-proteobacteria)]